MVLAFGAAQCSGSEYACGIMGHSNASLQCVTDSLCLAQFIKHHGRGITCQQFAQALVNCTLDKLGLTYKADLVLLLYRWWSALIREFFLGPRVPYRTSHMLVENPDKACLNHGA